MRALVYSRVSTDAQERDGTSLETQERAGLEHARGAGYHVPECIRGTASGYSLDRPGIERVRQLLRSGAVDVVIAYAVDRLSRNQNHIGVLFDEVEQAGARLELVTERFEDTAVGRFILAARAFIAEVEREKIAERTMRAKLERARSGRIPQAIGKGTYGYVYNPATGKREIDPFQAEVVRRIFQRYADCRSFTAVARELNKEGIPSFTGGRWYPLTVRRMLTNESYVGRLIFRRTKWVVSRNGASGKRRRRPVLRSAEEWIEIKGASPQIVDAALWQRVRALLADPERIAPRSLAGSRLVWPVRRGGRWQDAQGWGARVPLLPVPACERHALEAPVSLALPQGGQTRAARLGGYQGASRQSGGRPSRMAVPAGGNRRPRRSCPPGAGDRRARGARAAPGQALHVRRD